MLHSRPDNKSVWVYNRILDSDKTGVDMRTQYTVKFKNKEETQYKNTNFSSLETAHNFYKHIVSLGLQAKIVKKG
jgi:hypothetical protein